MPKLADELTKGQKLLDEWLIKQLHLKTDNVHIHNTGLKNEKCDLILTLYSVEKGLWKPKPLGILEHDETRWISLKPLSFIFRNQTRPDGESVLVVNIPKDKTSGFGCWRMDNMKYKVHLNQALYEPADSFSFTGSTKSLKGTISARNSYPGFIGGFTPLNSHYEYWYEDVPIPNPIP